jgi:membrane carboxypeptidase/penicillin-binding protein PbpC
LPRWRSDSARTVGDRPRINTAAQNHIIYWKTGASNRFRDAWTAGIFGHYALVVWIGDFDGAKNPSLAGVRAAAPLFFAMVDAINDRERNPERIAGNADGEVRSLHWFADSQYLGSSKSGETFSWRPLPGQYILRVVDDQGRSDMTRLHVVLTE